MTRHWNLPPKTEQTCVGGTNFERQGSATANARPRFHNLDTQGHVHIGQASESLWRPAPRLSKGCAKCPAFPCSGPTHTGGEARCLLRSLYSRQGHHKNKVWENWQNKNPKLMNKNWKQLDLEESSQGTWLGSFMQVCSVVEAFMLKIQPGLVNRSAQAASTNQSLTCFGPSGLAVVTRLL